MRGAQNRLSRHVLMAPMDAALMRNVEATVYPWIGGTWKSAIDFEGGSVGFFVLIDERVVSLCFSVFVSDGCHAIDMLTIEKFRGLGLAKAVASAFMDECVHRCLKPTWDCYEHNLPSRGLAQVLGFRPKNEFPVYSCQRTIWRFSCDFPSR
ncbi:GNAT family N-acetyltransferase [Polaromonas sp. UC242_47]|uniref:GNAT family N-acetyltransferase n=1 Tax=Polaromonas sp. UC242_47 TaxID=3374626 RepID=UPI00378EC8E5